MTNQLILRPLCWEQKLEIVRNESKQFTVHMGESAAAVGQVRSWRREADSGHSKQQVNWLSESISKIDM